MLTTCSISDALITWIPVDEEPLCGNAAVYAVIILVLVLILILIIIIIIIILLILIFILFS